MCVCVYKDAHALSVKHIKKLCTGQSHLSIHPLERLWYIWNMVTLSLDITSAIAIKCSIQGDRGKAPEGQG